MKKPVKILLSLLLAVLLVAAPLSGATSVLADLVVKAHAVSYSALSTALTNYVNNAGYNSVSYAANGNGWTVTDNSTGSWAYKVMEALEPVVNELVVVGNGGGSFPASESNRSLSGQTGNFIYEVYYAVYNNTGCASNSNKEALINHLIPRPTGWDCTPSKYRMTGVNTGGFWMWKNNDVDEDKDIYSSLGDITVTVTRSLMNAMRQYTWSALPTTVPTSTQIVYHCNHWHGYVEWDQSVRENSVNGYRRKAYGGEYNYFSAKPTVGTSATAGASEIAAIKAFGNRFGTASAPNARLNYDLYSSSYFTTSWLTNEISNNNTVYNNLINIGSSYYTLYFTTAFVSTTVHDTYMLNCEAALLVCQYKPTVDSLNACYNAGTTVNASNYTAQKNNYNNSGSYYSTLTGVFNGSSTPRTRALSKLQSSYGLKAWTTYTAYRTELKKQLDLYDLRQLKSNILSVEASLDAARLTVTTSQPHKFKGDASAVITSAVLGTYRDQLNGWYSSWNSYDAALRNTVAAESPAFTPSAVTSTYVADISFELSVRSYIPVYNTFHSWFEPRIHTDVSGYTDDQLMTLIKEAEAKQTDYLNNYNACLSATNQAATTAIFSTYSQNIQAYINSLYTLLSLRMTNAIDVAWSWYSAYNNTVNFNNFTMVHDYINDVSERSATYDFLQNTSKSGKNFFKTTALSNSGYANEYTQLMNGILQAYKNLQATGGLSNYSEIYLDGNTGTYYTRKPTDEDLARQVNETGDEYNSNKDNYTVTTSNINSTVSKADDFLSGNDFAELAHFSSKGANLPAVIETLLNEQVYTNRMINLIVSSMYPNLVTTIETQLKSAVASFTPLKKSWGNSFLGFDAEISAALDGAKGSKSFPEVFRDYGLYLYPSTFADMCTGYPAIYNACKAMDRTWNTDTISGFDWGIDSAPSANKEAMFRQALNVIINTILPVVQAAFCGYQGYSRKVDNVGVGYDEDLNYRVSWIPGHTSLTAQVNVTLRINAASDGASALYGYNDILGPIFEALGVTDYNTSYSLPSLNGAPDAGTIVNAVVGPIEQLVEQLKYHPLDKILSMLPNLAHAVSFNLLQPLFNSLPVTIGFQIGVSDPKLGIINSDITSTVAGWFTDLGSVYNDHISIDLGQYVNLQQLLGISDITDLNSVISYILLKSGVTDPDGDGKANFTLPYINGGQLGFLGSLTTRSSIRTKSINGLAAGKRYTITADKADVFWFLLKYIAGTIGDTEFLKSVFKAMGGSIEISDTLAKALKGMGENPEGAASAIIELFNEQKYGFEKYNWVYTNNTNPDNVTAASGVYLNYNSTNEWTRAKASYVYDNINEIIQSAMTGQESESISDIIADRIQSFYRKDNIADMAETLGKLKNMSGLDSVMIKVVKDKLGIDLSYWDNYTEANIKAWKAAYAYNEDDPATDTKYNSLPAAAAVLKFKDGDETGFKNAVISLLAPASSLIAFLLGDQDLSMFNGRAIYTGSSKVLNIEGYQGYTRAVVPLFKALGVSDSAIKTQAQFQALGSSNYISYILNTIFAQMDAIVADPIHKICQILPGLLYFVYSDGLSTCVDNLLHSAYCLVDTARPVFDLDIMGIIRSAMSNITLKDFNDKDYTMTFPDTMTLKQFLGVDNLFSVAQTMTGLKLDPLLAKCVRGTFVGDIVPYTSGSFSGYTTSFKTNFQPYDVMTIVIELAVELIDYSPANKSALANILKINENLLDMVYDIIGGGSITATKINWCYFDKTNALQPVNFKTAVNTQENDKTKRTVYLCKNLYLTDWTDDSALYLQANFDTMVNSILAAATKNTDRPITSLSQVLADLPTRFYNNETLTKLAVALSHMLDGYTDASGTAHKGVGAAVLEAVNCVFDLGGITETVSGKKVSIYYKYTLNLDAQGVHDFGVTAGNTQQFETAISNLLKPLNSILQWMLFGQTANFLYGSKEGGIAATDGGSLIVVPGFDGYKYGIIPLMEALGISSSSIKSPAAVLAASKTDSTAIIKAVIDPLLGRIDELIAAPDTLMDMLPDLIYFVNCGGLSSSLTNSIKALDNIVDKVNAHIDETDSGYPIEKIDLTTLLDGIDITSLNFYSILNYLDGKLGIDLLHPVGDILAHFSIGQLKCYTSANGLEYLRMEFRPDNAATADVNEYASDRADMMTIMACMLIVTLKYSDSTTNNVDGLAALLGKDDADTTAQYKKILSQVLLIMSDEGDLRTDSADWLYMLKGITKTFKSGDTVTTQDAATLNYLKYKNTWDNEAALTLANNVNAVFTEVLADSSALEYHTPTALINGLMSDAFSDKTIYAITSAIADNLPAELKKAEGLLDLMLNVDLEQFDTLNAKYKAAIDNNTPIVTDAASFKSALIEVLSPLSGLLNWLMLGDDLTFFNDDKYPNTPAYITISGAQGYSTGVIPLLEALGCTGIKTPAAVIAESKTDKSAVISAIVEPLMNRLIDLTSDTVSGGKTTYAVDKLLSALPNIIYYANAGGIKVSVNNMLAAVSNVLDEVDPLLPADKQISLDTLMQALSPHAVKNDDTSPIIDISDLNTNVIIRLLEARTGITLPANLVDYLSHFYLGTLVCYTSANGSLAYKTVYTDDARQRADLLTVLLSVVLETAMDDSNVSAVASFLKKDEAEVKGVFDLLKGKAATYVTGINWFYMFEGQTSTTQLMGSHAGSVNTAAKTVTLPGQTVNYLAYPNDWNKTAAEYLSGNLDALVKAALLLVFKDDPDKADISCLLNDLLGKDLYTGDTVKRIETALSGVTAKLQGSLGSILGVTLDMDLTKWTNDMNADVYPYGEGGEKAVTDEASFRTALKEILSPVESLLDYLFLGRDFRFFYSYCATNNKTGNDLIVLKGAEAYDTGLIPLLEAFGCAPASKASLLSKVNGGEKNVMVSALVDTLFDKLDGVISSDTPASSLISDIPNIIYFINAGGLTTSVGNMLAGVDNLLAAVAPLAGLDQTNVYDLIGEQLTSTGSKLAGLQLNDLSMKNILALLDRLLGTDISTPLLPYLQSFYIGHITYRNSASVTFPERFTMELNAAEGSQDRADMITIFICMALEALEYGGNAAALDAKLDLGLQPDILEKVVRILTADYSTIDADTYRDYGWLYMIASSLRKGYDQYTAGQTVTADYGEDTANYLKYMNDWTSDAAGELDNNLTTIADLIISRLKKDDTATLASVCKALASDKLYTEKNVLVIGSAIYDLASKIDDEFKPLIDYVTDIDLSYFNKFVETDADGNVIKNADGNVIYKTGLFNVTDEASFDAALTEVLKPFNGALRWLLLGDDFDFFNKNNVSHTDEITIKGGEGWNTAVVPLFEHLGCENVKTKAQIVTALKTDDGALVKALIDPLLGLVEDVLASPVDKGLEILPNIIYFINAGGFTSLFHNLLIPADNLVKQINTLSDKPIDIYATVNKTVADLGLDLDVTDISMKDILGALLSKTGLTLGSDITDYLSGFYIGRLQVYSSANGQNGFRTVYTDASRKDLLTVLISVVLDVVMNDANIPAAAKLLGLDEQDVRDLFAMLKGQAADYTDIDWFYMYEGQNSLAALTTDHADVVDTANKAVRMPDRVINYLAYPNDWNKSGAEYLANNLNAVVTAALRTINKTTDSDKTDVAEIVKGMLNEKAFTAGSLRKLEDALSHAVSSIDASLVSVLNASLGVDITRWTADLAAEEYPYAAVNSEASFRAALKEILSPVERILEFLFLGQDYKFFYTYSAANDKTDNDQIVIKGAEAYDTGLVPILEALGCDPAGKAELTAQIEAGSDGVLVSELVDCLFDRLDGILGAQDPIAAFVDAIPNVIYFLNAGGLNYSFKNILAGPDALLKALKPLISGLDFDNVYDLVLSQLNYSDSKLAGLPLKNLDLAHLIPFIDDLTGLELNDCVGSFLSTFYIGEIDYTDSASLKFPDRFTMKLNSDQDRADMVTILMCLALEVLEYKDNAAALDSLLRLDDPDLMVNIREILTADYSNITPDTYREYSWLYPIAETLRKGYASYAAGTTVGDTDYNADTAVYLQYLNNWTSGAADYLDKNLSGIADSIVKAIKKDDTATLSSVLTSIANDKLYTEENVLKIGQAVYKLASRLDDTFKPLINYMTDVDLSYFDRFVVKDAGGNVTFRTGLFTVTDRASFEKALTEVLAPFNGALRWLLVNDDFDFFNKDDPTYTDEITIKGNDGWDDAVIPLLEHLGCTGIKTKEQLVTALGSDENALVTAIVDPLLNMVEKVLTDPADELLDRVPNLIYYINAGGLTSLVHDLLVPVNTLISQIDRIKGVNIDLYGEINKAVTGLGVDLDVTDISMKGLLGVVKQLTSIDIGTQFGDYLSGFYMGRLRVYGSANGKNGFAAEYVDATRKDLITALTGIALGVLQYEPNRDGLVKLFGGGDKGANTYAAVMNVFDQKVTPLLDINWYYVEKANTGEKISPLANSAFWPNGGYGKYWTREKAQYVAANFGSGVDNIITLLGIHDKTAETINTAANNGTATEVYFNSLKQVLGSLVGGKLYTEANAEKILAAIKGAVDKVNALEAKDHIKAEVKRTLGVDLDAWNGMSSFGITDGDKTAFISALLTMIRPLEPVLAWMLRGDKDIKVFYNADSTDAVVLKSSEGYAYGIIPLLEALGCDTAGILTPAQYNASADENADNMILNIVNPLLGRLDVIFANPADEILAMLPEVIYFVNSDGLDVCFRNLLRSVYNILDDIRPVTDVDLYNTLGFHLDTDPETGKKIDFNYIIDWALGLLQNKTGYQFAGLNLGDTVAQLSLGTLTSFSSKNGDTAYRMVYAGNDNTDTSDDAAMVTLVATALVKFVVTGDNANKLKELVNSKVSSSTAPYIDSLIDTLVKYAAQDPGSLEDNNLDLMLGTFYYLFYGANTASKASNQFLSDFNTDWSFVYKCMSTSDSAEIKEAADQLYSIFEELSGGVFDMNGLASKGLIPFFQKLVEMFQKIIAFFQSIFKVK